MMCSLNQCGIAEGGNYWNAAAFNTPSSYLHFSTFHGETSADISFYFKTSAPYGVFLENLGNTDFIRLELKSPTEVSFSFDVGNGPVELLIRSSTPLNDDQWHRVMAERNVKQASLQLDQLYKEVRQAPPQGHTRLELYSQLYVGAAGGQKGFLGCIRSLKMNGVTLDLEERAKVTPGVKPGCSGHCTSYGMYCRNGGKCIEKYNGYSCDCSKTAYDGPFCTKGAAGGQKGFLGCIRSLKMNGVTLDLEERAKVTPGVKPGCSGHCTSYGMYCRNGGKCIEKYNGYSCDCSKTAYDGPFCTKGTLQIRYNLGGTKEPFKIDVDHRNMANGQPHSVNISRHEKNIQLQLDHYPSVSYTLPESSDIHFNSIKTLFLGRVHAFINNKIGNVSVEKKSSRYMPFIVLMGALKSYRETGEIDPVIIQKYNTPGFSGCLSRVQFNQISPLKAALRPRIPSPVGVQGQLVESNCGASPLTIPPMSAATDPWRLDSASADSPFNEERVIPGEVNRNSAIIGGVIAVVIFTILCTLVFLIRYMFRHKGTYHTNEAKGAESADTADAAIMGNDPNFTETIDESKKEWFI
ncbi:UNVERIFIED_CONTAM: hypothetical protein FKN15_027715 [Acipenser sinensis]